MKNALYTPTIILMAIAAGICTGGNYFSQPLIHSISVSLNLTETTTAWVPTLAQITYACGLLFLMPLGDIIEKRKLLFIFMLLASSGLIISGFFAQYLSFTAWHYHYWFIFQRSPTVVTACCKSGSNSTKWPCRRLFTEWTDDGGFNRPLPFWTDVYTFCMEYYLSG